MIPTANQVLPIGTEVGGSCAESDPRSADRSFDDWLVFRAEPARVPTHSGQFMLTGVADAGPRGQGPVMRKANYDSTARYPKDAIAHLVGEGTAVGPSICFGDAVALDEPGVYVFERAHSTYHYIPSNDFSQTGQGACNDDDRWVPRHTVEGEQPIIPPPHDPNDPSYWFWSLDSWCREATAVSFYVSGYPGVCQSPADLSNWPVSGYINQYDAGKKAALPKDSWGEVGGSACGPASLLMGLAVSLTRLHGPSDLWSDALKRSKPWMTESAAAVGKLQALFDGSMLYRRGDPKVSTKDNGFDPYRAERLAVKSLGFTHAKVVELGSSDEAIADAFDIDDPDDKSNEAAIDRALRTGR